MPRDNRFQALPLPTFTPVRPKDKAASRSALSGDRERLHALAAQSAKCASLVPLADARIRARLAASSLSIPNQACRAEALRAIVVSLGLAEEKPARYGTASRVRP